MRYVYTNRPVRPIPQEVMGHPLQPVSQPNRCYPPLLRHANGTLSTHCTRLLVIKLPQPERTTVPSTKHMLQNQCDHLFVSLLRNVTRNRFLYRTFLSHFRAKIYHGNGPTRHLEGNHIIRHFLALEYRRSTHVPSALSCQSINRVFSFHFVPPTTRTIDHPTMQTGW